MVPLALPKRPVTCAPKCLLRATLHYNDVEDDIENANVAYPLTYVGRLLTRSLTFPITREGAAYLLSARARHGEQSQFIVLSCLVLVP